MTLNPSDQPSRLGLLGAFASSQVPNVQVFTGSGTWLKPTGARVVHVELVGGGAAGGGAAGATTGRSAGGGGGAGGYAESIYDADDLADAITVTVGAGATASGGNGGASSFHTMSSGNAGGGASGVSTTTDEAAGGGGGGSPTGGTVKNIPGGDGGHARILSGRNTFTNGGGASFMSGGRAPTGSTAQDGNNGRGPGAGGSGAYADTTTRAGGDGSDGLVIVVTYF